MTKRHVLIGLTSLLIAASVAATVAILTTRGADATVAVGSADPHAARTVSKDVLNAVDKITRDVPEAQLVAKGRELFRNSTVAKDGESCQGCHTDGGANNDIGTTPHVRGSSTVDSSFQGPRDPPTLFNVGRTDPYFWIGNVATLNEVAVATIENHWKPEFQANKAADAAALTAYMTTITPPTTDFDRGTMSAAALRGEALFQGKGACVACHGGPDFTDNLVHDTLVPQAPAFPSGVPNDDPGREAPPTGKCGLPGRLANPLNPFECAFNTPTLRGNGLAKTAPYMHNGVFATLAQVVSFYNTQSVIAPLQLTSQEQADLVEYLKAL